MLASSRNQSVAAGTNFIMVGTDPLAPSLQSTYVTMLFIIPTLMLLKISHIGKDSTNSKIIRKFQLPSQIHLYYYVFLHHEAEKIEADKLVRVQIHICLHYLLVHYR